MGAVEFDRIADVYDETRRALDEETLAGMRGMLAKYGCRSILEVGVGTGRVATPLKKSGFQVAGLDISRRMMGRARQKGIEDLVLADGRWIPFRAKSFDAALMAHVFHLMDDPLTVMREAARVSGVGVFALLEKRDPNQPWFPFFWASNGDENAGRPTEDRRRRFSEIAEKYHWDWEKARRRRNWGRETEILETHPPDELKVVSDVVVSESIEDRISRFEKGAYGFMSEMPVEMREEIVREMRAHASSASERSPRTRHEVFQVALWRSEGLLRGLPKGRSVRQGEELSANNRSTP